MREHPLDLSARLIETGVVDTPPNRVDQVLSELADGVALVESFSHVLADRHRRRAGRVRRQRTDVGP